MKLDWKSFAIGLGAAGAVAFVAHSAKAADLSGSCCADIEERIAELEATTARKGTKKVTVNIYGQLSEGILFWDDGDFDNQVVQSNSAAESFIGVRGEAKIDANWKAGFVLEIGTGGYEYGIGGLGLNTHDIYTRTAALYLDGPVGRLTLGQYAQASDNIAEITTANTAVASRMLSLRPLTGPNFGDALDLFDGTRGDVVRYDSPVFAGFVASASWAAGIDEADVWDIALRYAGEFSGFRFAAGVGYRDGIIVPGFIAAGDTVQVWSGSASLMHVTSGLFVNVAAGRLEPDLSTDDLRGLHVQGGIEQKLFPVGKTTFFAEWMEAKENGSDEELTAWGGGVVQAIDAAALDLFINARTYEIGDEDVLVGMGGARIRF